jgi:monoterpene epsilon-lactone hydrolase
MPEWRNPEVAGLQAAMAAFAVPPDAPRPTWPERRVGIDAMGASVPPPESCLVEAMTLGGVAAEKIAPSNAAADRTIFYLHGGGYCVGGCASHRTMVARMAEAARASSWAAGNGCSGATRPAR